jgi:hypothetical protein
MKRLLPCCLPLPCGTWLASFSTATLCAVGVKNKLMLECFVVFLRGTEFSPPMSRRQGPNRRELLLPLLIPDRHQTGVLFDACVPSGRATAINGKAGEPPNAWSRHSAQGRVAERQTTKVAIAELIVENRLLAQLVFQRIRPCNDSGIIGGQNGSPDELQRSRASMAPPDIATSLLKCAGAPVSESVPPAIETLFTQLARRRLRSRTPAEIR